MTTLPWRIPHATRAFSAVLFDLDGVVTNTLRLHVNAWERMFSSYFAAAGIEPPYSEFDYHAYVDGRPRYDGVRACLASRNVKLPEGSAEDEPGVLTVCGLGNLKNMFFDELMELHGVDVYPGTLQLLDQLAANGVPRALVTSSRNALPVLRAAGLTDAFPIIVDGLVAVANKLSGKPAPDTYLFAAQSLGVAPSDAVVVEDAVSGVASGRHGNFGLVIGVDRGAGRAALEAAGADLVVDDLAELVI